MYVWKPALVRRSRSQQHHIDLIRGSISTAARYTDGPLRIKYYPKLPSRPRRIRCERRSVGHGRPYRASATSACILRQSNAKLTSHLKRPEKAKRPHAEKAHRTVVAHAAGDRRRQTYAFRLKRCLVQFPPRSFCAPGCGGISLAEGVTLLPPAEQLAGFSVDEVQPGARRAGQALIAPFLVILPLRLRGHNYPPLATEGPRGLHVQRCDRAAKNDEPVHPISPFRPQRLGRPHRARGQAVAGRSGP